MRSTRSFSRARTSENERGFALLAAIALAVLYFAMIQLMLIDSARELAEARRFKARVVAAALAENGAELAAYGITTPGSMMETPSAENWQGKISGKLMKAGGGDFVIEGKGSAAGITRAEASVQLVGRVENEEISIYYAAHKP